MNYRGAALWLFALIYCLLKLESGRSWHEFEVQGQLSGAEVLPIRPQIELELRFPKSRWRIRQLKAEPEADVTREEQHFQVHWTSKEHYTLRVRTRLARGPRRGRVIFHYPNREPLEGSLFRMTPVDLEKTRWFGQSAPTPIDAETVPSATTAKFPFPEVHQEVESAQIREQTQRLLQLCALKLNNSSESQWQDRLLNLRALREQEPLGAQTEPWEQLIGEILERRERVKRRLHPNWAVEQRSWDTAQRPLSPFGSED